MSTLTEDIRRFTPCLSVHSEKVATTDYTQKISFHTYQLIIIRLTIQLSRSIFKQPNLR